ncbi:hypothetical protein D1AOALGA4SA_3176 [Olavius algarvensis Delta 1 endosymbiont]|nr:hypothetical protein D1AOALGA4SA_3176 [Olavius algarvensis Delta 1 endosymbiont]
MIERSDSIIRQSSIDIRHSNVVSHEVSGVRCQSSHWSRATSLI